MLNIEEYIEPYRQKLKEYYSVSVAYDQPKNELKSHYNTICLCLRSDYTDIDFFHELTHLKFMTEECIMKYYYPKRCFFDEVDRFAFINSLVNIVYDIYVDSYLSVAYASEKSYFEKKIRIYDAFLKNAEKVLKLKPAYVRVIKNAVADYSDLLYDIVHGKAGGTLVQNYVGQNNIESQRKRITEYLIPERLENDFEWLVLRDIYEREQKEKEEKRV